MPSRLNPIGIHPLHPPSGTPDSLVMPTSNQNDTSRTYQSATNNDVRDLGIAQQSDHVSILLADDDNESQAAIKPDNGITQWTLFALINSTSIDNEEKVTVLSKCSHTVLNELYERHVAACGPLKTPASTAQPRTFESLTEDNYLPLLEHMVPSPNPEAPTPIYPGYAGHFTTSEQARRYRKRARLPPKAQAPDVARVRRYGRKWSWILTVRHN